MNKSDNDYQVLFTKDQLIYTSCYCEENIWKLVESLPVEQHDNFYAVFISNESKSVPIWYQSKSDNLETPVVWDYHVIGIHKSGRKSFVYDMDTVLEFPTNFETYYKSALKIVRNRSRYQRFYRVVPAKYYLKNFSSDRSHMIDEATGLYQAQPPTYKCIKCENSNNNLHEFTAMNETAQHGTLMSEEQFEKFFQAHE